MNLPYIIIDDDQESVLKTKAVADGFSELVFVAAANTYAEGLNLILEHNPKLIFLEIDPADKKSNLSLALINELYRYLSVIPKIIITTTKRDSAFEAIQYEVADYLLKPVQRIDLIKSILKMKKAIGEDEVSIIKNPAFEKLQRQTKVEPQDIGESPEFVEEEETAEGEEKQETSEEQEVTSFVPKQNKQISIVEQPLVLCIKSYGDYRYIDAKDICYFQADNNSTDIHLSNGEMVTAFKTLKHFEGILTHPFIRIHNSYILNRDYISRIHTGNAVCYIKNTTTKIPFSKSYKENVDTIISDFANGNYLEI
ncbi:MAG: LytTR family transcriptional regulator DNA-binding domain-containing protein [Flavobacterium sp.]|uniref:LytR/AlgR family response regulator transcription factor n=1 Tax=Flavobacterium sp. TaxID=239 RepID=UPI00262D6949|nr:LytTR family DNA-binding domain-containing protein [Flavobacterium sp.]MDD5149693.1 LytTR family transcriptional regulator DNA-binding domain-containing protein [Flavobacterium sp.]